jgi:hypothetical protein
MESKERVEAANALIQWFNSQDISQKDALVVMNKVAAKIIVGALPASTTPAQREALDTLTDAHTLSLVHEINERLFHVRRK